MNKINSFSFQLLLHSRVLKTRFPLLDKTILLARPLHLWARHGLSELNAALFACCGALTQWCVQMCQDHTWRNEPALGPTAHPRRANEC
eukprot:4673125-Amphidinium_carterae.1